LRFLSTKKAAGQNVASATNLDFEDYRTVFRHKSTWELMRALLILRVCSVNLFVDNSLAVSTHISLDRKSIMAGWPDAIARHTILFSHRWEEGGGWVREGKGQIARKSEKNNYATTVSGYT
jgi:hypothetical protein